MDRKRKFDLITPDDMQLGRLASHIHWMKWEDSSYIPDALVMHIAEYVGSTASRAMPKVCKQWAKLQEYMPKPPSCLNCSGNRRQRAILIIDMDESDKHNSEVSAKFHQMLTDQFVHGRIGRADPEVDEYFDRIDDLATIRFVGMPNQDIVHLIARPDYGVRTTTTTTKEKRNPHTRWVASSVSGMSDYPGGFHVEALDSLRISGWVMFHVTGNVERLILRDWIGIANNHANWINSDCNVTCNILDVPMYRMDGIVKDYDWLRVETCPLSIAVKACVSGRGHRLTTPGRVEIRAKFTDNLDDVLTIIARITNIGWMSGGYIFPEKVVLVMQESFVHKPDFTMNMRDNWSPFICMIRYQECDQDLPIFINTKVIKDEHSAREKHTVSFPPLPVN